jgi:hypothetical protein
LSVATVRKAWTCEVEQCKDHASLTVKKLHSCDKESLTSKNLIRIKNKKKTLWCQGNAT